MNVFFYVSSPPNVFSSQMNSMFDFDVVLSIMSDSTFETILIAKA